MKELKITLPLFSVPATVTKNWGCSVNGWGPVAGFCEHGNGLLDTKITGSFLTHRETTRLSDRWVHPIAKAMSGVASLA